MPAVTRTSFHRGVLSIVAASAVAASHGCGEKALAPSVAGPVLTTDERSEVLEIMRSVVPSDFVPTPMPHGLRPATFDDIPALVAAVAPSFGLVVVGRRSEPDRHRIWLWTDNDRPGTVDAFLHADGSIDLRASIGRVTTDQHRTDALADAIIARYRAGVPRTINDPS